MVKIITANVNGIRSAEKKGFFKWLEKQNADFICLQELKAQDAEISDSVRHFSDYDFYPHYAQKKGYSGCAVYSKLKPLNVYQGFSSPEFDPEGRYVALEFDGFILISIYFPSGSSSELRQEAKYRFLAEILPHLNSLKDKKEVIFCGDVNIAHKEIDIKNWKGNLKNSGFLPEERNWLTELFEKYGWVDVFRKLDQSPEKYTWWSNRGQARAKNVGWRIDYQIATSKIADQAYSTEIYTDERFSDHAPLIIEYRSLEV